MGADNRRIDKEIACQRTGVRLEPLPELAPDPAPLPAAKAVRDRVPVAKLLWEVAPGRPRAGQIKNGFDAHPIAEPRGTSSTGFDSSEDGSKLRPCLIRQQQTYRHQVSSIRRRMHGREKTYPGIMNSSTRPSIAVFFAEGVSAQTANPSTSPQPLNIITVHAGQCECGKSIGSFDALYQNRTINRVV